VNTAYYRRTFIGSPRQCASVPNKYWRRCATVDHRCHVGAILCRKLGIMQQIEEQLTHPSNPSSVLPSPPLWRPIHFFPTVVGGLSRASTASVPPAGHGWLGQVWTSQAMTTLRFHPTEHALISEDGRKPHFEPSADEGLKGECEAMPNHQGAMKLWHKMTGEERAPAAASLILMSTGQ
jgi:hypothetical protein